MDREVMEWLVQGSNNSIGVIAAAAAGAGCASMQEKKQLEEGMKEGRIGAVFSEEVEKT